MHPNSVPETQAGTPAGKSAASGPASLTRRTFLRWAGATPLVALLPGTLPVVGFDRSANAPQLNPSASAFPSPKAGSIPTATGTLSPADMGITSVHEHIVLPQDLALREKSRDFAISELKKAKALGLKTIVDVGPTDDVAGIREVSLASGVNVVCCTGSYLLKDDQQALKVKDFENRMRRDIEEGLQGTQIRPGVIKVAARGLPIKPAEKNLFIAAARIQKQYNLTICTHAVSGCVEQQQILEQAGADLRHCYFSHVEATFGWSGRTVQQEIDYLQGVVEKGSALSFNNFGNWDHTKPKDLALIIQELTQRGFEDRMVATMDVTWSFVNGNIKILWEDTNEEGKDRTYSYPLRKVVPWLREQGIPKATITKFMVDNPRRLFTWA